MLSSLSGPPGPLEFLEKAVLCDDMPYCISQEVNILNSSILMVCSPITA